MLRTTLTLGAALAAAAIVSAPVRAGTIENLERERAITLETLLSPNMTQAERFAKVAVSEARLVDLERMVLRDKALDGRNTAAVRKAFANYDLTFLVHAATEKNLTVTDQWLEQLGLTSQNIMMGNRRRR